MPAAPFSRTRRSLILPATVLLLLAAMWSGGCAARTDGVWAQTAPVISPVEPGREATRLGAVAEPVAMEDPADETVRN
jgi:hypothetical protein